MFDDLLSTPGDNSLDDYLEYVLVNGEDEDEDEDEFDLDENDEADDF